MLICNPSIMRCDPKTESNPHREGTKFGPQHPVAPWASLEATLNLIALRGMASQILNLTGTEHPFSFCPPFPCSRCCCGENCG